METNTPRGTQPDRKIVVREAKEAADVAVLRLLMRAYAEHLARSPGGADGICLENFEAELDRLPQGYARLLLALVDGDAAGCVALKTLTRSGERACEMKRLWVEPGFRGLGLGRILIDHAIHCAAAAGFDTMYLDTVPAAMPEANSLYASMGFQRVDRYNQNSVPGIVFFRRHLS